jgi:tetratricopeptide (TPR) repeat protein
MAAGQYARAVGLYTRVLCGRPRSTAALANRSLAHLKLKDHCACIADATLALRQDAAHVKCWLRRATARSALGQHALALSDLEVAHALDPGNKTALAELRKAAEMVKACRRRRPEMAIRLEEE